MTLIPSIEMVRAGRLLIISDRSYPSTWDCPNAASSVPSFFKIPGDFCHACLIGNAGKIFRPGN